MAPSSESSAGSDGGGSPASGGPAARADLAGISDDESASAKSGSSARAASPAPSAALSAEFGGGGDIVVEEEELDEDELDDAAPSPPVRRGPAHRRAALALPRPQEPLSIVQMPPAIDVPLGPSRPEKDELPKAALTRIMYRMKKNLTRQKAMEAMEKYGPQDALLHIAESNTRLVTWSDGSRTLMVGNEHFSVVDDREAPPNLYVFRKGTDVQCYHGQVETYARVQPSMVSKKRNTALLMSGGNAGQPKARQMLRTLGGSTGDREEEELRKVANKRARELARRQNKQRRIGERAVRQDAQLTRRALEDDDDDDDDDVDEDDVDFGHRRRPRWEEEQETRRKDEEMERKLRQSKLAAMNERKMDAVRRRNQKVGTRRVISDDEDDDDEDDDY